MPAKLLKEVEGEVTQLLSDLIKINTTNPPGNETEAARFLAENLSRDGFDCEIFESAPGRGSLVTRVKGSEEKPSLLLLSHLDVVAANAEEWSVDPFGGVVKDGFVWGRGALDMKGMTAVEVMVLKLLKRNNVKLKGDVLLAATADEERGGVSGVDYLLRRYPEKIHAPYVLNEGGGSAISTGRRNLYVVQTAEKGLVWFKVKAKGVPGHGSMPDAADNAILRMSKVIERLGGYHAPVTLVPAVARFLRALAEEDTALQEPLSRLLANPKSSVQVLDELSEVATSLREEIEPRLKMTVAPTMVRGGVKENIIPSECETVFDCRILPGQTVDQALTLLKGLLSDIDQDRLTFEVLQAQEPSESPVETPLYNVISRVLGEFDPGCGVAPMLMTGGTDSRFFRKTGSVCYGFFPRLPGAPYERIITTEHGIDERVSVENLVFGTSVLYETVRKLMS
ncbi:M20/M25/M40 family metallo-hydrolase [Candidatus Bathyarchaeota archaeon A05DMB-2]|nr:M20/M25/M40 family metallo-hydrolase [Candidatus Bathyarchaeota archaeon A05DMB-2]